MIGYKYLYLLYIVVELVFGALRIGSLSPRIILTLLMFVICKRGNFIYIDEYFKIFLIFIFFYILSGFSSGYVFENLKWSLSFYFCSFVAYMSTRYLIEKHNGINFVYYTLLIIGLLDAIVTIGQYYGVPVTFELGAYAENDMELVDDVTSKITRRGNLVGVALPGILGTTYNGVYLSFLCVLSLFHRSGIPRIYNFIILLISLTASFVTQERTGTAIGVILSAFFIVRLFSSAKSVGFRFKTIILCVASIIILLPVVQELVYGDNSRYDTIDDGLEIRNGFWASTMEFLQDNPLGGSSLFAKTYGLPPHNLFLNMLVTGGIFGAIVLLVLFVKQLKLVKKAFIQTPVLANNVFFVFSLAYLATIINSLTHNCSFVRGDPICWILFAVVVSYSISSFEGNKNYGRWNKK